MKTRVQKWGNSLAIRIPKSFAAEAGLGEDTPVELSLVEGKLVIQPVVQRPPTLAELLRGVTDENIPGEWDTGRAVGREGGGDAQEPIRPGAGGRGLDHSRPAGRA